MSTENQIKEGKLKTQISALTELNNDAINAVFEVLDKVKQKFPMEELQFLDTRDTEDCKRFQKHIAEWFKECFGEA